MAHKLSLIKRLTAVILAVLSVFYITPFSIENVAKWIVGRDYDGMAPREQVDMLLDMYVNQDFIYLSDDSEKAARDFMTEFLVQIFSSQGDGAAAVAAIDSLPIYSRMYERDAKRTEVEADKPENIEIKETISALVEGSSLPDNVKRGFSTFTNGINDVYIYFIRTQYDGVYQFAGDYVTDTGEVVWGLTPVYYDSNTQKMYGMYNAGIFNISFDCNIGSLTMDNAVYSWQRKFGYNFLFDVAGNIVLIDTDTVRVRF